MRERVDKHLACPVCSVPVGLEAVLIGSGGRGLERKCWNLSVAFANVQAVPAQQEDAMAASEELGILGVDNFHYFVSEPERSRQFYQDWFGWQPVAKARKARWLNARVSNARCTRAVPFGLP